MSAVTKMWRQLVQRRLWPVAILLIAALVAVPLTLAKEPAASPPPPPAAAPTNDELAVAPIVAVADTADRAKRRRVLGAAKNPFAVVKPEQAPTTTSKATVAQTAGDEKSTGGESAATTTGGGMPSTTTPAVPDTAVPAPAPSPAKRYEMHELTVRFGEADGAERMSVERLEPLPSAEDPVLVYLGVRDGGKTAEFLISDGVAAVGDGECRPTAEECETVRLRAGETEFFDVTDEAGQVTAQYQLDLVKIHRSGTASAAKAKAGAAGAGRRSLQARVASAVAQLP